MRVDRRLEIGANAALIGLVFSGVAYEHFPVFGILCGTVSVLASVVVIWQRIGMQAQSVTGEQDHAAQVSSPHFGEHASLAVSASLHAAVQANKVIPEIDGRVTVLASPQNRLNVTDERSKFDEREADLLKEYIHDTLTKGLLLERDRVLKDFLSSREFGIATRRPAIDGKRKNFGVVPVRGSFKWSSNEVVTNFGCVPAR